MIQFLLRFFQMTYTSDGPEEGFDVQARTVRELEDTGIRDRRVIDVGVKKNTRINGRQIPAPRPKSRKRE